MSSLDTSTAISPRLPREEAARDETPRDDAQLVATEIVNHARYALCRPVTELSPVELFTAVALSVRARLVDGLFTTDRRLRERDPKTLNYLSIEYLLGRSLGAHLDSLGLRQTYREALRRLGADLETVEDAEPDAALGNRSEERRVGKECRSRRSASHDNKKQGTK